MVDLVERLGIVFWEVFFLVPVGRGEDLGGLTPEQCEELFEILYAVQKRAPFVLKVTEAQHYRRYVAQHEAAGAGPQRPGQTALPQLLQRSEGPGHTVGLAQRGVNAGNGFAFVSHTGDVFPSGFLPAVRRQRSHARRSPQIYRDSPLFRTLRDPDALHGPLRSLRVSRHLRRLALARLRAHGQLPGHRPVVWLSAGVIRPRFVIVGAEPGCGTAAALAHC